MFLLREILCFLSNFLKDKDFSIFLNNLKKTISSYLELILIDLIFILFIIKNDYSLVLGKFTLIEGDKSHHTMTLHLAQINHLFLFIIFFYPNTLIETGKHFHRTKKILIKVFILTVISVVIFNNFR